MAELSTIARPYAEAVFRLGKESGNLAVWSEALANLALLAANEQARQVVSDPRYTLEELKQLLVGLLGKDLIPEVGNFITILLENRRFTVLPAIAEHFEALKAFNDGKVDARIETAFALSDSQLQHLTASLTQQFKREVTADVVINPDLIGGVRVSVGDLVVDASVRGKLAALSASLKS